MTHPACDVLNTSFSKDPATLDPRRCGDAISSVTIFLLFKGLTRLQANHEIILDIADSFYISSNGKQYTFHLGEHYWNNGKQISAFDFERSWKTILSPDFPALSAHLFYPIKNAKKAKSGQISVEKVGVYAEGPRKLVVELEGPTPYFLELVSFCSFFPVSSNHEAQFSLPKNDFVCSGPYQLERWEPRTQIILKKNPLARNSFAISLEKILIYIIPDAKQAFSLFEKGQLDWIGEPFSPLPLNHLPAFLENWKTQPVGAVTLCFFNTQQQPFSDPMLRQAFSLAIQREKVLRKLSIPHASIAKGLVPPILKGNRPTKFFPDANTKTALEFFQDGIKALKISPKKLHLILIFEASEIWFQIAKCLQKDWQDAFSIKIELEPLEFKAFYDRLSKRQYTFALARWMAQYTSPMNILERFRDQESGKNFSGWENKEYGAILKRYDEQVCEEKRIDLVEQAEALLTEHMPATPIYYFSYSYLKKPYVKNLLFSPIGRVYLEQVFLDIKQQQSVDEAREGWNKVSPNLR